MNPLGPTVRSMVRRALCQSASAATMTCALVTCATDAICRSLEAFCLKAAATGAACNAASSSARVYLISPVGVKTNRPLATSQVCALNLKRNGLVSSQPQPAAALVGLATGSNAPVSAWFPKRMYGANRWFTALGADRVPKPVGNQVRKP